jgi:hypothetical protein
MEKNDWLASRIAFIQALKSPTESQKMFLELAAIEQPTRQEAKQFDVLVRLEKINQKAEETRAEAARMMAGRRDGQRKARAHALIQLGGIVSMVDFPVDRGTLTGTLLWALDQMKTDETLLNQLKTRGDTFIAAREAEKTAAQADPATPVEAA